METAWEGRLECHFGGPSPWDVPRIGCAEKKREFPKSWKILLPLKNWMVGKGWKMILFFASSLGLFCSGFQGRLLLNFSPCCPAVGTFTYRDESDNSFHVMDMETFEVRPADCAFYQKNAMEVKCFFLGDMTWSFKSGIFWTRDLVWWRKLVVLSTLM